MPETTIPFVKKLAAGELTEDGYEPQSLWLIPIQLRSRITYYQDVIESAKRDVEGAWSAHGRLYRNRDEFDASDFVRHIWQSHSPYWWGLNDIIGFVDIRACVRAVEIQAALFLTTKRPSRILRDRIFVHRRQEVYALRGGETNPELQDQTIQLVRALAADASLKKRYIDLPAWERAVRHTDLVGLMLEALHADRNDANA